MTRIEELRFQKAPLRVSRGAQDDIKGVCLGDLCRLLKRTVLLADGTALRRCPSAAAVDVAHPKEMFAPFNEALGLVKWICAGSKILEPVGRELVEMLQEARISARQASPPLAVEVGTGEVITLEYSGHSFAIRPTDGRWMVNATEMSRPFEKRPAVWLKLVETVRLRQALVEDGVCRDIASQVETTRGPQGLTWLDIHLCPGFAGWLSPAFAFWCSKRLASMLKGEETGALPSARSVTPRLKYEKIAMSAISAESFQSVPADYGEALAVIDRQRGILREQGEFLRQNRHKFEHYDETVDAREWFSVTVIANELGVSAIALNQFLADEGLHSKIAGEWVVAPAYCHLRDTHIYEWYNHRTRYTNKYKLDGWTPAGREYIIELWKKSNG